MDLHQVKGLYLVKTKARQKDPLTLNELGKLWGSPLFTGYAGDKREHIAGEVLISDERF